MNHEIILNVRQNKKNYLVTNSEKTIDHKFSKTTTLKEFFAFLLSLELVALFTIVIFHFAGERETEQKTFVPVPIDKDGESYVFDVPNGNPTPQFPEQRLMVNLSDEATIDLLSKAVVHAGEVLNPGSSGIAIAMQVPQK